jgi:hypothetical protein
MAESDETPSPAPEAEAQAAADVNVGESVVQAAYDVVWVFGQFLPPPDVLPPGAAGFHPLGDADHLLAAVVSPEAPANLDHALDQLTTGTDLFDLPAFDFHSS